MVDAANPITPVEYVVQNDPLRKSVQRKIDELEGCGSTPATPSAADDIDATAIEAEVELLQQLYDVLEDEGVATARGC